jgi:hypothetical protein
MDWIYGKVGNFGIAILLITVLIAPHPSLPRKRGRVREGGPLANKPYA